MADKLTIRIDVEGSNQTVSKFVAPEKGQLTFHNDTDSEAEIKFEGPSPVCVGNDPQPIFIIEANTQEDYKVCKDTSGKSFKYTATVAGSEPEDPILFVEHTGGGGTITNPIFWVEMLPGLVIGLVLGAVAGFLLARRRGSSSR